MSVCLNFCSSSFLLSRRCCLNWSNSFFVCCLSRMVNTSIWFGFIKFPSSNRLGCPLTSPYTKRSENLLLILSVVQTFALRWQIYTSVLVKWETEKKKILTIRYSTGNVPAPISGKNMMLPKSASEARQRPRVNERRFAVSVFLPILNLPLPQCTTTDSHGARPSLFSTRKKFSLPFSVPSELDM